ncbi:MAG: hypothetical protein FMNOHCHN_00985 [Ignavibacteriaceae bacterium]|nr:hypothetical protein [Ignavibacteriaceae bacterium]
MYSRRTSPYRVKVMNRFIILGDSEMNFIHPKAISHNAMTEAHLICKRNQISYFLFNLSIASLPSFPYI